MITTELPPTPSFFVVWPSFSACATTLVAERQQQQLHSRAERVDQRRAEAVCMYSVPAAAAQ